jgi:hypothetical protein
MNCTYSLLLDPGGKQEPVHGPTWARAGQARPFWFRFVDWLNQDCGWPRRGLFALGRLVALAIMCRVLLDPLAAHFTRKELNVPQTISGDSQKVHVSLFPPYYEIWHLKIIEAP